MRTIRAVATVVAALLATGARAARAQSSASLLVGARMQLEAIQADSAATLLVRALDPRMGASAAEQTRGWTLLGVAELLRGRTVSARLAFRHGLERDPQLSVDSLGYLHSELRRVFAAEREAFRLEADAAVPVIAVRLPADTVVTPNAGQWPIEVQPRRRGLHRLDHRVLQHAARAAAAEQRGLQRSGTPAVPAPPAGRRGRERPARRRRAAASAGGAMKLRTLALALVLDAAALPSP